MKIEKHKILKERLNSSMTKKTIALLLALLLTGILYACDSVPDTSDINSDSIVSETGSPSDPTDTFLSLIQNGEYQNAVNLYTASIAGNATREHEAEDLLRNYCIDVCNNLLGNQCDTAQAETAMTTVRHIVEETGLLSSEYETLFNDVQAATASKAAFAAAEELKALKKYADAIASYRKVLKTDADYNTAQNGLSECTTLWKEAVFSEASGLADKKDYLGALALLDEMSEVLTEDNEITVKRTVYVKSYIDMIVSDANAVFVTPEKDYAKALEKINAALQHYPENEELNTQKEYYSSFAPLNLYDANPVRGEASTQETDTDTYGNAYEKSFWAGYSGMIWNETDITFDLSKSYNTFSAVIYGRSNKIETQNMTLEIYADGNILYQRADIADNTTNPYTIELDVTGVSELRIFMGRGRGAIGSGIGMTEIFVQRTVK